MKANRDQNDVKLTAIKMEWDWPQANQRNNLRNSANCSCLVHEGSCTKEEQFALLREY